METMMYPCTDKRMRRTRDAIRRALLSLLSSKDAESINVSELTQAADISRKTFYLHYSGINEALTELENEIERQVLAAITQGDLRCDTLYEVLSRVDGVLRQPAYAHYLSNRGSRCFMLYRLKNAVKNCVKEQLQRSNATAPEEDLEAAADFAVSGVISMYCDWLAAQRVTLRQLTDKAQALLGGALQEFLGKKIKKKENGTDDTV